MKWSFASLADIDVEKKQFSLVSDSKMGFVHFIYWNQCVRQFMEKVTNLLNMIYLREWKISIIDCYHIITILYCLGFKFDYLLYFAILTRVDEFLGSIIFMFGKKRDFSKALDHLMKSKSLQSLDLISLLHCLLIIRTKI